MFHISFLSLFPQAECQRNEDCAQDMACEDYNCINPCQTIGCEKDYFCKVIKHVATCGRKFVPVPQEVSMLCCTALFRNKRFELKLIVQQNASKFTIFYV